MTGPDRGPSAARVPPPPVPPPPRAARRVGEDWAGLASPTADPTPFCPDTLAALPEPARRYLTHVLAPGTPLWQSVEVSMVGQLRLRGWWPFTATQIVSPTGYIWAADTRVRGLPLTGYDRYTRGTGEMRWRLLNVVPVMSATGPDVARSAAGRLASEIALLPTAYRGARWSAGGPDTALATWGAAEEQQQVALHLGADGRLLDVLMERWGNPDGEPYGRYPFGATFGGERTDGGVTLPSTVRAGWWWGTDRQAEGEFFRMEITDVIYR